MRALIVAAMVWGAAWGQDQAAVKATEGMAASAMKVWPVPAAAGGEKFGKWGYEEGVLLDGMAADWQQTKNRAEFEYVKAAVDEYVIREGAIQMDRSGKVFAAGEHQLDNIELGRAVLFVYREAHDERYAKAAKFLEAQLAEQPRTASGGYWHKQIYPNQMWLDGAYMAEPFRAMYAATFSQPGDFDDIAKQFLLMYEHMRDSKTGLLKHGWDESKQMAWADKATGLSPEVWARAVGWYCMGLVDTLDWFPKGNPLRAKLVEELKGVMAAVVEYQDRENGLWWQVMDRGHQSAHWTDNLPAKPVLVAEKPAEKGNFIEASASCMFVYALAKGVRMGYLPQKYEANARQGWAGIQKKFVTANADGTVTLTGTVKVGGLGGTPYRSGSYEYYIGEKVVDNDAKGVGAYLLAGSEMEQVKR